uniref:GMP reductase n=1 Tax=Chrysemys picta bellii TaxID=8478 RepID=A0A8C3IPG4_CHRPI
MMGCQGEGVPPLSVTTHILLSPPVLTLHCHPQALQAGGVEGVCCPGARLPAGAWGGGGSAPPSTPPTTSRGMNLDAVLGAILAPASPHLPQGGFLPYGEPSSPPPHFLLIASGGVFPPENNLTAPGRPLPPQTAPLSLYCPREPSQLPPPQLLPLEVSVSECPHTSVSPARGGQFRHRPLRLRAAGEDPGGPTPAALHLPGRGQRLLGALCPVPAGCAQALPRPYHHGLVCTTRKKTGVGYPQLSAVLECADAAHGLNGHIISDGGCSCPGDVAKAFGAGADFVMLGGMLAGHTESGGELIERGGKKYKLFYGMSSEVAMKKYAGGVAEYRASEGRAAEVPFRGAVENTLRDVLGGLRSTCTYVGAAKLKELSHRTTFIRVTPQGPPLFGAGE